MKRREAKSKGEKEIYKHLNAEFQRIARRDKKAFLSDECKEITSPGSMHDTGCLGLVHWEDTEGGYGEGGGRRVQDGEHMIHFDIWQNQYNYVKLKNKKKK